MAATTKATDLGMHTEQLAGRSQQRFFRPEEDERFTYPQAFEVDFKKRAQFDAGPMSSSEVNLKLRELMSQGFGTVVMKNPGASAFTRTPAWEKWTASHCVKLLTAAFAAE